MLRPLLLLLLIIALVFGFSWIRRQPPAEKRKLFIHALLGLLIIAAILLALTGRIHWIGAVIAALLPFAKMLIALALQLLPFWRQRRQEQQRQTENTPQGELAEALDTLGLTATWRAGTLTEAQVHEAHKRLMQKVHPDRGGNDWLAARVNRARETVLKHLS